MRYKGESCGECGNIFAEDDDVVVCPDCGTPHHRACYKLSNRCANFELHPEGYEWQSSKAVKKAPEPVEENVNICPQCNCRNDADADECRLCGYELTPKTQPKPTANPIPPTGNPFVDKIFSLDPNEDMDGICLKEAVAFVRTNILYYIPLFRQMFSAGRRISVNLLCFLFPPIYFANRRMWFWAIFTAVMTVLFSMPLSISYFAQVGLENSAAAVFSHSVNTLIANNESLLTSLIDICNGFDLVMRVLLCLFGNRLYYRFVVRSVKRIKAEAGAEAPDHIRVSGGIKPLNTVLILLIMFAITMLATFMAQFILQTFV